MSTLSRNRLIHLLGVVMGGVLVYLAFGETTFNGWAMTLIGSGGILFNAYGVYQPHAFI